MLYILVDNIFKGRQHLYSIFLMASRADVDYSAKVHWKRKCVFYMTSKCHKYLIFDKYLTLIVNKIILRFKRFLRTRILTS